MVEAVAAAVLKEPVLSQEARGGVPYTVPVAVAAAVTPRSTSPLVVPVDSGVPIPLAAAGPVER